MKYPYGYCGMPCALCSRYRIVGNSRCTGCSSNGYYTDTYKVHHCCCQKKLKHCSFCSEYCCSKLGKMNDFSDLNTNHVKGRTSQSILEKNFDSWYFDYCKKADLLTIALEKYNDGRMKRYLCELFIQNEIDVLREIMNKAKNLSGSPKENGKNFKVIVENILKLRKAKKLLQEELEEKVG